MSQTIEDQARAESPTGGGEEVRPAGESTRKEQGRWGAPRCGYRVNATMLWVGTRVLWVGYGLVWDIDGKPSFGECSIESVSQEHGVATSAKPLPFDSLHVGTKVRIAPNHACITAAAHDRYYVVDGSREVIAEWDRVNGW